MADFSRQLSQVGAVDIPSDATVMPTADYSGIVNKVGGLLIKGFENKAVEDFLGGDLTFHQSELQTGNIKVSDRSGNIKVDVPEITGLRSIAQARKQGLSANRAQVLANAKLTQALANYPQHREAILAAYDNVVDPLGSRGPSIFDPTAQEQQIQEQRKREQEYTDLALKAGYADGDWRAYFRDLERVRLQKEQHDIETEKLSTQENIKKVSARTLSSNIYKAQTLLFARVGSIIQDNVNREGLLTSTAKAQLFSMLNQQELELKQRISSFSANSAFDVDKSITRLENDFKNFRQLIEDQDATKVAESLVKLAQNASELEAWQNSPSMMMILNTGGAAGIQILDTLTKVTGDEGANKTIKEKMQLILDDQKLAEKFQNIMQQKLSFASFDDPEDKKKLSEALAASLQMITDKEGVANVSRGLLDAGKEKSDEMKANPEKVPPIDKPAIPELASFLDPKTWEFARGEGKEKFVTLFNDSLSHLEEQIRREGKGVQWEIAPNGDIIGYTRSVRGGGRGSVIHRYKTQEDVLNKVIVPLMGRFPDLLSREDTMALPLYKKKLVDNLNLISNPPQPTEQPTAQVDQSGVDRLTRGRGRMAISDSNEIKPQQDSSAIDQGNGAITIPLQEQPKAIDMTTLSELSQGLMKAETGGLSDPFIRTKAPEEGTSSTAYGPLQLTYTTAKDIVSRHKSLFTPEELDYVNRFIEQGKKFIKYGREPNKEGYDKRYDYGGQGDLTSDKDKEMYYQVVGKMLKAKALDIKKKTGRTPSILEVIESWRGKSIKEDPRYFSKVLSSLPLADLNS